MVADKGYEILFFTEHVDEFAIKMLMSYKDKEFKSVSSSDLDLGDETEKETEAEQQEHKELFDFMPDKTNIKADKILEINTIHPVFESLKNAFENDKDKLTLYTNLLYNQALLIEGLSVEDPVEFSNDICKIMV